MVRVYVDGEYGCGGADEEDVGKMPDQVGIFVPLCSGPTIRKRKNNKKEKNLTGGMEKLLDLLMFVRNLGENKERTLWKTKGKSWCISRMKSRGWR